MLSLAFIVSKNTSSNIEDVIWNMPIQMVFKCVSLVYTATTGTEVPDHKKKKIAQKQQEKFKEISNG